MAENASSTVRPDSTTVGGGGTKVENLLKALNECLEMRGETSANNESAEMNGHHSGNTDQGFVTEQNSLSNGHLENLSDSTRTVTTNGTEKYDDIKDNESVKMDNTPSTKSTTAIPETGEEPVGGVEPCQSTTSGAEAANGSEALEEEEESATESLLAQKLAVVMEKLEAYKATRDYMLTLANKLKEQNDRYEAEFGNVGGEGGSDAATNNDHGLPEAQSRSDDLEVVSNEQLSSTWNGEKDHPINPNSATTVPSIQSEGKVEQCKETNAAVASNSNPEIKSSKSNHDSLNCSNAVSNNISQQTEKGPEAHCNDDGGDDDVNADYDDYYYDVSEELEYQYEEDDNNEEQNKNDVQLNLTASDNVVVSQDNRKENVSKNVTEMKNTETVKVAKDAEAAKNINSNTSVNFEAASSKSATDTKLNPTTQENNKISNDQSSEKQQLEDSTNKTTSTATAKPKDSTSPQPVKDASDRASSASGPSTEAIQSDLASLSKVERLNLMFRLQTEFAKLQLSLVETQEHMRAATAALQRLATLECQDDSV